MDETSLAKLKTSSDKDVISAMKDFNLNYAQTFSFPDFDLYLKKELIRILLKQLSNCEGSAVCLETLRILSREKTQIEELFPSEIISLLVNMAGLVAKEEELAKHCTGVSDPKVIVEALKCLCNLIYNSSYAQKICCNNGCVEGILLRLRTYKDPDLPHDVKFFDMRLLFLLTALCAEIRPLVRDLHGLTYLTEVLSLHESDISCEVLKVLFNLTVNQEKDNLEESEEAHYLRLVSILRDLLLLPDDTSLHSHTVDLLTTLPTCSYEELLTPALSEEESLDIMGGSNFEAISVLLIFLESRLDKPNKESLAPILTTLSECCRAHPPIRKFVRKKVLPPLSDVMTRPEEGSTLRNRLVKLMTSPVYDIKELVADFLFVLCKENVGRLIKYTGYGNAAGLLANRGLLLGRGAPCSDSEDSDTDEYLKYKDRINPVLGCYQDPPPDPLEGMSDEQKEYEALQLVNMMDKLASCSFLLCRDGLIQPMRVDESGKPCPVEHVLQLRDPPNDPPR